MEKMNMNFFNRQQIKKMREMLNGDTLIVIYLKMIALTDDDGLIPGTGHGEDITQEIAWDLNENITEVRTVVSFLEQHLMGEVCDDGLIIEDAKK